MSQTEGKVDKILLTIHPVRSFKHGTFRTIIFRDIDPNMLVGDFISQIKNHIRESEEVPFPMRFHPYDCLKISNKKTIGKGDPTFCSLSDDQKLMLNRSQSLGQAGVKNEDEIAFFNLQDYKKFKESPG
ncbi:UPF0538 protein C2orf76 [Thelohanellus kitauei]|uniref:UPF0538 protein C2orf76 n=1 Tax=Thelohanellus kitauei TaxID=669202 RepID=A0A0C2MP73_THEKT|nr:UPF0538 protein C2orf76 [Thelohanellus kitauei]